MSVKRSIPNDASPLRREQDPQRQLMISLRKVIKTNPPCDPWQDTFKPDPRGLWTGPTSIAYLFFSLSKVQPTLTLEGQTPEQWCHSYLDCGSGEIPSAKDQNSWGVKNEYLAYNSVKAALTKDMQYVRNLIRGVTEDYGCSDADNEFLSGRAGALALLRFVRHWVPEASEQVTACMPRLVEDIIKQIPWRFNGHNYIGAAHGVIGIITQVVLSIPEMGRNPAIESQVSEQLDLQAADGHWFITDDPNLGSPDLVHFCHGAPGFVISLKAIRPFVNENLQERIDLAVQKGQQNVWENGLLTKEPNLCHGITGNMIALASWDQRDHFMSYTTDDKIQQGILNGTYIKGGDPSGLQWGESGRAWGWMMMASRLELGWPGYTDI